MTFRKSNISCFRCVKYFSLLVYKLTDLLLPNYNNHSIQFAAVSQPDMNELAATEVSLRSANELPTDDCTTGGRITERIVRWCSSVTIQQQYRCLRHLYLNNHTSGLYIFYMLSAFLSSNHTTAVHVS